MARKTYSAECRRDAVELYRVTEGPRSRRSRPISGSLMPRCWSGSTPLVWRCGDDTPRRRRSLRATSWPGCEPVSPNWRPVSSS